MERERVAELEAILNALPDLFFRMTADGTILDYHKGVSTETYAPPERFLNRRLREVLPTPVARRHEEGIRQALDERRLVTFEYSLQIAGQDCRYEARILPVGAEQVLAVARDITARKRAEEELRQSEERFRRVFEEGPLGMTITGRDLRFLRVNTRLAEMLGYTPGEMIGLGIADITYPEDIPLGEELTGKLFRGEIPRFAIEKRYLRKGGGIVWGRLTASAIHDEHGKPIYGLAMIEDITGHKRIEAERARSLEAERRAREQAEAALRTRDEFISVAAHELKTPITNLRGYAELTLRRMDTGRIDDPQEIRRALETIDRQADRLSILTRQLLDLTRLESGELMLRRQATDLVALVRRLVAVMQSGTTRHTLTLQAPPSLAADVDPARLELVLYNLIDNAVKYSPEGGPVEVELLAPAADTVRIAVRDHGIGIPPEQRPQLFTRFFKAGSQRPAGGLGLGLHIGQRIVALHGGTIRAEFPEDGGSRFIVTLPRKAKEQVVEHE